MSFWSCALLSGLLFGMGLMGFLWRASGPVRGMSAMLMVHGAMLLFVAGAAQYESCDGQAAALLVLGLLPVQYIMGLILWRQATSGEKQGE